MSERPKLEPTPYYCCQVSGCAEECAHDASDLRLCGGLVVCEGCYDWAEGLDRPIEGEGDDACFVLFCDLPRFVPAKDARIAELEAREQVNEEMLEAGQRAGWPNRVNFDHNSRKYKKICLRVYKAMRRAALQQEGEG